MGLHLVENRDGQAVKLAVGALGHDLVENPSSRIVTDPPRQNLANSSRSLAFVAVKTLAPITICNSFLRKLPDQRFWDLFIDVYIPRSRSRCKGAPNDLRANYSQSIGTLSLPRRFGWRGEFTSRTLDGGSNRVLNPPFPLPAVPEGDPLGDTARPPARSRSQRFRR